MSHNHPPSECYHQNIYRLIISLILNLVIVAVELVAGIYSHSLALISDSMHNLSDVSSILITLGANKLSLKKATYTKSFGFKRAETIAAILNVLLLLLTAAFLFWKGVERIQHPEPVMGRMVILVSLVALAANLISVFILRKGASCDLGIKSTLVHLMTDAISSLGVLAVGITVYFTRSYILDPVLSMAIALFILANCWGILKEALNILLEGVPKNIDLEKIKARLNAIEEIHNVHHIHVWGISSRHINASLHILLDNCSLVEAEKVMVRVCMILREEFGINHVTIQPETQKYHKVETLCQIC
ncbi:MAG: cation diffusion facilitator family transporter [bacterium]